MIPQTFNFPFLGSKRNYLNQWESLGILPKSPNRVYEPFAGSAVFSLSVGAKEIRLAESEPALRLLWDNWGNPELDDEIRPWVLTILEAIAQAVPFLSTIMRQHPRLALGYENCTMLSILLKECLRVIRNSLKVLIDNYQDYLSVQVAAAYAIVKRFAHGGLTRYSGNGLNAAMSLDKCLTQRVNPEIWSLKFPGSEKPSAFQVFDSNKCLEYVTNRSFENRDLVLIDPPYYVDLSYKPMTAAYMGHLPQEDKTLDLCLEEVTKALQAKVGTIIITNYYSDTLHTALLNWAAWYGRSLETFPGQELKTLSRNGGNRRSGRRKSKDSRPSPIEYTWVIRGNSY